MACCLCAKKGRKRDGGPSGQGAVAGRDEKRGGPVKPGALRKKKRRSVNPRVSWQRVFLRSKLKESLRRGKKKKRKKKEREGLPG